MSHAHSYTEAQKHGMYEWLRGQVLKKKNPDWFNAGLAMYELARLHEALRAGPDRDEALALAHNALTFAKPMIGALCADSPTADLREKRNKVYAKVETALAAVIASMRAATDSSSQEGK